MTYNDFFNLAKEKGLETIQITEETVIEGWLKNIQR